MLEQELTEQIIGAAIEVHRYGGPGLYEEMYERSLTYTRLIESRVGLLINFHVPGLKDGIKRLVL